jgi:hypothetical protein
MGAMIDGQTLNIEGGRIQENVKSVGTFVDKWEDEKYKKKAKILGSVRSWSLRCYEENVAWTNSIARHLQEHMEAGDTVSFNIDEGDLHTVSSTNVYILDININYGKGAKASSFIRHFTLRLQEAP